MKKALFFLLLLSVLLNALLYFGYLVPQTPNLVPRTSYLTIDTVISYDTVHIAYERSVNNTSTSDELRVTSENAQGGERYDVRGTKYEAGETSENSQNVGARRASPVNNDNAAEPPIRHSSFVIRNCREADAPTSYCRDLYSDSVALITIEDSIRRDSIVWRRVRAQLAVQVKNQRLKIQEGSDEYPLPTSNFVLSPLGALLPTSNLQLARSAWGYFVGVSYSPQMGIGIDGGVRYKRLYLGAELRSRAVVEHNQLCYGVRAGMLF